MLRLVLSVETEELLAIEKESAHQLNRRLKSSVPTSPHRGTQPTEPTQGLSLLRGGTIEKARNCEPLSIIIKKLSFYNKSLFGWIQIP